MYPVPYTIPIALNRKRFAISMFDLEKMVDDFENLLEKVSIGHLT